MLPSEFSHTQSCLLDNYLRTNKHKRPFPWPSLQTPGSPALCTRMGSDHLSFVRQVWDQVSPFRGRNHRRTGPFRTIPRSSPKGRRQRSFNILLYAPFLWDILCRLYSILCMKYLCLHTHLKWLVCQFLAHSVPSRPFSLAWEHILVHPGVV